MAKLFEMSNGKKIYTFDNVFDFETRRNAYSYIHSSRFVPLGGAQVDLEQSKDIVMCSFYELDDVNKIGIFHKFSKEINDLLDEYVLTRCYAACSNYSIISHFHSDGHVGNISDLTFLYYVNMKWDPDWGGETVFANEEVTDIEAVKANEDVGKIDPDVVIEPDIVGWNIFIILSCYLCYS